MEIAPKKHSLKRLSAYLFLITGSLLLLAFALWPLLAPPDTKEAELRLGEKLYRLEISDSSGERARGLGERDSLCTECGMLFLFEEPGLYGFWMKGMRFPLDILWLSDHRIVHIERRVPADSQEVMVPEESANQVLELNAGEADSLRVGEEIQLRLP